MILCVRGNHVPRVVFGSEIGMKNRNRKLLIKGGCAMRSKGFYEGEEDLSEVRRVLFLFCFLGTMLIGVALLCLICTGCGRQDVILYGESPAGGEAADIPGSPFDPDDGDGEYRSPRAEGADGAESTDSFGDTDNLRDEERTGEKNQADDPDNATDPAAEELIYVQVCGAVEKPGVYAAKTGTRIYEFIEMAGGLTEDAAPDAVNQAQAASDGDMIRIPTVEQWEETKDSFGLITDQQAGNGNPVATHRDGITGNDAGSNESGDLININTADEALLCTLPGIGAAKAAAIIEYRNSHGGFSSVDDIRNVSGIGEKLYQKIRDKIKV